MCAAGRARRSLIMSGRRAAWGKELGEIFLFITRILSAKRVKHKKKGERESRF